jgi:hypothetical protein
MLTDVLEMGKAGFPAFQPAFGGRLLIAYGDKSPRTWPL